jgi:hypothetical protein
LRKIFQEIFSRGIRPFGARAAALLGSSARDFDPLRRLWSMRGEKCNRHFHGRSRGANLARLVA